jgi:hypothetical protein
MPNTCSVGTASSRAEAGHPVPFDELKAHKPGMS